MMGNQDSYKLEVLTYVMNIKNSYDIKHTYSYIGNLMGNI